MAKQRRKKPGQGRTRPAAAKRNGPAFDPKAFLAKADGGRRILKFRKGQTIFAQAEIANSVFYIQKGKIKITVMSKQGKDAVVALLSPEDFFGEGSLTGQPLRLATAAAMTDCVVVALEKEAMARVLREEPEFSGLFIAYILARNTRVEADLVDHMFNSSEKRLARLLLQLANFGKDGNMEPIETRISQEMLAEMVGTTRSRVNTFMNKFRQLGLVEYNGSLKVHRSLLNVVLHD